MGKIYAEEIIRKIREAEEYSDDENFFRFENRIERGYIIVKYEKLELEERVLMDGRLSMILPKAFKSIEEEVILEMASDPVSSRWIYCDEEETVSISFDFEEGEVEPKELEEIRDEFVEWMLQLYPDAEIQERETMGEGAETITRFSLILPMPEEDSHHTVFFRALPEGLLMGIFDCCSYEKKQWGQILIQLLRTLKEQDR